MKTLSEILVELQSIDQMTLENCMAGIANVVTDVQALIASQTDASQTDASQTDEASKAVAHDDVVSVTLAFQSGATQTLPAPAATE